MIIWLFCLMGLLSQNWMAPKGFETDLSLPQGLHYLEFWADRKPVIENIKMAFSEAPITTKIPTVDNPRWTGDYNDDSDVMLLARALWGEARGATVSREARIAVACSIRNRLIANGSYWGGNTYHGVILQPNQYSSFWEIPGRDPNLKALRDPIGGTSVRFKDEWYDIYQIAEQVIDGTIPDNTLNSNSYFNDTDKGPPPWAKQKYFKINIGPFHFYEL